MSVSFGKNYEGYAYSYDFSRIEKYCEDCGIPIQWYPAPRDENWQTFDTHTGKKYLYEVCFCPTDKKRLDAEKKRKRNASLLERWWIRVVENEPALHVGYYSHTPYYRRYLQSNLEVVEEAQHGT
ncbi:MAG: hypothetical protein V3U54_08590 [Thermodesulfobacteriota bacterium]